MYFNTDYCVLNLGFAGFSVTQCACHHISRQPILGFCSLLRKDIALLQAEEVMLF